MRNRTVRSVRSVRPRSWLIGSDPGLLRLRTASRTTVALAAALGILYLLTRAAGQPMSVALLGVVIAMTAARSAGEPDPRRQRTTMALLPVPAIAAITAGVLLAPYRVAQDVVFVVIVFVAVYLRRFGGRGMALGMVAFMTYFFGIFLRARIEELPWLALAILIGTACSIAVTGYLWPDRPQRVLRHAVPALWVRLAAVVDTTAAAVRTGRLEHRRRRRLWLRARRLNDTALQVLTLLESTGNEDLAIRLFDAELAAERLAAAGGALAVSGLPADDHVAAAATLDRLAAALRSPRPDELRRIAEPGTAVGHLGLAVTALASAALDARTLLDAGAAATPSAPAAPAADTGRESGGLRPTTRQAIQVAVAASLAIVAGELVSPARWYWAVIAAFVVFAGTSSWGETLSKGWQRLLGTLLGVPAGVLVATLVGGDTAVSIALIFVGLFCAFYLMQVAYSLMIFWFTTVLALLYGLLGQFSFHVLLLRLEETAIGAVIGVAVAALVLPTDTRTAVRAAGNDFLTTLSQVVAASVAVMAGAGTDGEPTDRARQLDRDLQRFRTTAKPLAAGFAGYLGGRGSVRHAVGVLTACDHHARVLARCGRRDDAGPELADALTSAAALTRCNIDALIAALDGRPARVHATVDLLDRADTLAIGGGHDDPLVLALHALRQIDRAIVDAALDLGADAGYPQPG